MPRRKHKLRRARHDLGHLLEDERSDALNADRSGAAAFGSAIVEEKSFKSVRAGRPPGGRGAR